MARKVDHLNILSLRSLIFLLAFFPVSGFCNQYKELSLAQKVAHSDLVVIVKIISVTSKKCVSMNSCASVAIQSTLKGSPTKDIQIVFDGPIAESDPICCKVGATYLAFLKIVNGKYYQSTNGPYGIYMTNPEPVTEPEI